MSPEVIRKRVLQQPFRPFRVFLSDGAVYEVQQAEMILVMRREVVIALPKPGEEFARHAAYCDPMHVTRIEPINGSADERRPETRRKS